jgi:hypothetical protein
VIGKYLLAGTILALSGQAMAAVTAIGNAPVDDSFGLLGPSSTQSQTFGQVFTAPVSDVMTSFTLSLTSGLNANMVGVLATWNGTKDFGTGFGAPTVLYTSPLVSTAGGGDFTFSPNVTVTSGQRYVAYITIFGQAASGSAFMPLGDNNDPALDYFVWNRSSDPNNNPSWSYFEIDSVDALFSASFGTAVPVPEPQSWALLIAGFGLVGAAARRRRSVATA